MSEAEDKFGSKGKTNAALTLGIIGTGLAALSNNGGCGCGNNGGLLGGLFGGNNGNCSLAERAMQMAYAQGQMADNLAWSNRVQSMQDDIDLYTYINGQTKVLSDQNYQGRIQDIGEAAREEIKRMGGFTVGRIKFTDKDVDELVNTFKANKKAN